MKIKVYPIEVKKPVHFAPGGFVMRSTGMDGVAAWSIERNDWWHVGYVHKAKMLFTGLTGFPQELGKPLCEELTKIYGKPVTFAGAPEEVPEQEEESEDDDDDIEG